MKKEHRLTKKWLKKLRKLRYDIFYGKRMDKRHEGKYIRFRNFLLVHWRRGIDVYL